MKGQKFRKLEVWKKAMEFTSLVHKETGKFPASEMYGLTSQIRRAIISISLNITEGSGDGSDPEFKRFLNISLRSPHTK